MNDTVNDNDELVDVKGFGDYTVKMYRREDCKYFCIVVHETDDDSRVAGTTRASVSDAKSLEFARSMIERDMKSRR